MTDLWVIIIFKKQKCLWGASHNFYFDELLGLILFITNLNPKMDSEQFQSLFSRTTAEEAKACQTYLQYGHLHYPLDGLMIKPKMTLCENIFFVFYHDGSIAEYWADGWCHYSVDRTKTSGGNPRRKQKRIK